MLLQCRILGLNDVQVSHNEVCAFGSEPCRLFQLALDAVFQEVFLMPSGLPYVGMPAHAHSAVN